MKKIAYIEIVAYGKRVTVIWNDERNCEIKRRMMGLRGLYRHHSAWKQRKIPVFDYRKIKGVF